MTNYRKISIIAVVAIGIAAMMIPISFSTPAHAGAQHFGPQFFGSCVVRGVLTPSDLVIFHTHCGENR
jgi:hypothetical protein